MSSTEHLRHRDGNRLLARAVAIAALSGIALIHLVEIPGAFGQMPVLCGMFAALTVAAALVAGALVHADNPLLWLAAGLTAAGATGGYVLTRLVAVPFDNGDVGNWLEPLGLVSLFVQTGLLTLCAYRSVALSGVPGRVHRMSSTAASVSRPA